MPERGGIDVSELAEREGLGGEREPDVRVRELRAQPLAAGERDRAVVERELRQLVDRMPVRVLGQLGIDTERDDAEVRRCELPLARVTTGVAKRLELLEVREPADVDLAREVLAERVLEGLAGLEVAAREGPVAGERGLGPLPEQHLQPSLPNLEDNREGDVEGSVRLSHSFRLSV